MLHHESLEAARVFLGWPRREAPLLFVAQGHLEHDLTFLAKVPHLQPINYAHVVQLVRVVRQELVAMQLLFVGHQLLLNFCLLLWSFVLFDDEE